MAQDVRMFWDDKIGTECSVRFCKGRRTTAAGDTQDLEAAEDWFRRMEDICWWSLVVVSREPGENWCLLPKAPGGPGLKPSLGPSRNPKRRQTLWSTTA